MRNPLTLLALLPLAVLLVLAPGEAWESCASTIIAPLGTACDRAGCQAEARRHFDLTDCHSGNVTSCSWTGECITNGCNYTFCMTFPPAAAPVLIPELDESAGH
ncbi:uncharacterized protein LOC124675905 [Lolium rigidum]|uniref:uncharacterized protein LOC124675905 n=1 Tax=Lolium rigidum TaxID=89674 RepID=UPI001F5D3E1C|nr:uncharacterized protein LOC124675905 [Lolium rigidum]